MAEEAAGATATVENTAPATGAAPVQDADGGEAVHVEESARDMARTQYKDAETPEQRETRERAAFDKAQEMAGAQPRAKDGTFAATTGKVPLNKGENAQDDATATTTDETQPTPAKGEDEQTPEQREKEVLARRALRRDGFSDDEIKLFPKDKLLEIGGKRGEAQAKLDKRMTELQGKGKAPAAEDLPATDAEDGGQEPALPKDWTLPAEVLDFLGEPERKALTTSVAKHAQRLTQVAEARVSDAHAALFEDRCQSVQHELSAQYPSLKGELSPDSPFIQKFRRLRDGGQYQTGTRAGIRELMEDAALITFGNSIKQEVQQSMIQRNRATLANQPDPKTLQAPSKKATITREEHDLLAFEVSRMGLTRDEAHKELHKRTAGRQIAG